MGFAAFVITDIDFHDENEIILAISRASPGKEFWPNLWAETPPDFGVGTVSLID